MNDAKTDSQAYRDYIESRVLSAHPVEIVHQLYQVAIDNVETAIFFLKSGDNFGRSRAVTKAQAAVHELLAALDPTASASMCRNLAELYDYVLREIIAGHTRRSERSFRDALGVLTTLSKGWAAVRTRVLGDDQAAGAELPSIPEEQSEAAPETEISRLYTEPPQVPATARDWSC
jgi:flagellar biosynthetic protein FliS